MVSMFPQPPNMVTNPDGSVSFIGDGSVRDTGRSPSETPTGGGSRGGGGSSGSGYIVPPWTGSNTVTSGSMNSVAAAQPREWQIANIAAIGSVVPIVYGIDQVGARYLGGVDQGTTVFLSVLWCEQCIGVQSLCNNSGEAIPTSITVRHYDGSQTTPDARLKAAYQAKGQPFDYALPGTCYSVFEFLPTSDIDPAGIIATIKGLRVFDPRDVAQDLNDIATWRWTDNAALCLADFLSSKDYGYGKDVDWDTVKGAADFCDEVLGTGADQQKRRTVNWAITERIDTASIVEALRAYAGCFVVADYSTDSLRLQLVPDRPVVGPEFVLTPADLDGVPKIRRRGTRETPTVIRAVYTSTTSSPFKQEDVYDPDPLEDGWDNFDIVESTVNFPGINNRSAARREARERRLKFILGDLDVSASVKDIGLLIKGGDVISLPHPAFPDGKLFRVKNTPTLTGPARYQIECGEYQPQMYVDEVFPDPEFPDTTLPDPSNVPEITGLVAEERLVRHGSGTVTSRIFANWVPPVWPFTMEYLIELTADGLPVVPLQTVFSAMFISPDVEEGRHYVLRVAAKCRGFVGPWSAIDIIAQGKHLPPSDVERFTEALDVNGTVHLAWTPAFDIDPITYEVRRILDPGIDLSAAAPEDLNTLWAAAVVVASPAVTRASLPLQPPAAYIYMVKAKDSVGNYSVNPCAVALTVSLDDDARFVDTFTMAITETVNASAWTVLADPSTRWTSDRGESINFGHVDADPAIGTLEDLSGVVAALPHDAGTSELVSQLYDVGTVVGGTWTATASTANHDDSATLMIELSNNMIDWEQFSGTSGSASASRPARFARLRITSAGSYTLTGKPVLSLAAIPRVETGEILVGSTGNYTARTTGKYKGFLGSNPIDLEYLGTENYTPERDSITINADGTASFDVYLRDQYGERVTGRVKWTFRGV